jgi:RNA-binding protein
MKELTGADRRHLRGLANPRKVVVQVGESGVSPAVIAAIDAALSDHELIKVRLAGDREERRAIAAKISTETPCALAGIVGGVAIFYREPSDPEKRKIHLPSGSR